MKNAATPATAITSLNRKGGVGKTHFCWLTASAAHARGQRVLLVDLDPQANLTSSFLNEADVPESVEVLFDPTREPDAQPLIQSTQFEAIDLIPSSARLEPVNISDGWEAADLHFSLAEALAPIRNSYDFILFDCPPSLSLVSYAALCASDSVVIPLEAAQWGALGTQHIAAAIELVKQRYNDRLQLLGYLVSRFKARRTYQQTYLAELRKHFGDDAFETVVPDLAAFERAVTDRTLLSIHSPSSRAHRISLQLFDETSSRIARIKRQSASSDSLAA